MHHLFKKLKLSLDGQPEAGSDGVMETSEADSGRESEGNVGEAMEKLYDIFKRGLCLHVPKAEQPQV
jgi:hypothetical protein